LHNFILYKDMIQRWWYYAGNCFFIECNSIWLSPIILSFQY